MPRIIQIYQIPSRLAMPTPKAERALRGTRKIFRDFQGYSLRSKFGPHIFFSPLDTFFFAGIATVSYK